MSDKNPIQKLFDLGISRKKILEKTQLSQSDISILFHNRRKASLKQRKAFFDAFGIDAFEWDLK